MEATPTGSKVLVHTDLALSGAVAQYGRGVGMIQATASALMKQFADNLKRQLGSSGPAPASAAPAAPSARAPPAAAPQPAPPPAPAKPISGFSLMARVIWNAIVRLFTGRSS